MRLRLWPTVFTLPALAVLIGLGTWQVQRLHWKEGLIAERAAALAAPPVDLALAAASPGAFRRVRARGVFIDGASVRLVARVRQGQAGEDVVTPLRLDGGRLVLVDRGWVPPGWRAPAPAGGSVTVEGILREAARPSAWTPDNEPGRDVWYWIDPTAIARAKGLDPAALLAGYVEAAPAPGAQAYPAARTPSAALPNPHLGYALTWYGLAAALAVIYLMVHRTSSKPEP